MRTVGGGASSAESFRVPGGRVKTLDKNLVDAIIGGKDLDCGSSELSVNPGLTIDALARGHGSLLLDLCTSGASVIFEELGENVQCDRGFSFWVSPLTGFSVPVFLPVFPRGRGGPSG